MNQFFYSRRQGDKVFLDSFNINSVVRSYQVDDNQVYVMLNDGHEESREVPDYSNSGKEKGVKRERQWILSQILIEGEDIARFRKVLCNPMEVAESLFPKMPTDIPQASAPIQMEIPFETK